MKQIDKTELLDWVTACQSAYSMEQNPRGPFRSLPGQLKDNRTSLVEFVDDLLDAERERVLKIVYEIVNPIDESAWVAIEAAVRATP